VGIIREKGETLNPKSTRKLSARSGLDVSILGCGGGPIGDHYKRLDNDVAIETVVSAHDAGLTLFDTSPHYGAGLSEHRMGAALRTKPRDSYVLSTKVGRYLVPPTADRPLDRNGFAGGLEFNRTFDYTRDGTLRAIDQSMARLGLSRIDCLIIHDCDIWTHGTREAYESYFKQAMEGSYKVLHELRDQGIIKAIGVGVNEVDVCVEFARAGEFDFFLLAGRYTLLEQGALDDLFPICIERGMGIMLGGPYNSGILATGAVEGARYNYEIAPPEIMDRVRRIEAVCARHDVPIAAAALQFPLGHEAVKTMIPGAISPDEVTQNVALMAHDIPGDLWAELRAEGLLKEDAPVPG
jgi:D-threo-aldose 1-dehydrogenase